MLIALLSPLLKENRLEALEPVCDSSDVRSCALKFLQVLDGELITVQGKMNEVETKRKAFQSIGGDARVSGLWQIAQEVLRGELQTVPHGLPPVE